VNVIAPVFLDGQLVAWTGTAAHHIDVGGVNPGSEGPELEDIFGEGLVLPPVRLAEGSVENEDLIAVITENIRDPRSTVSDLRAQRAACALGDDRVAELARRYGVEALLEVMGRMLESVERGVKTALRGLPDGTGEAEGFLDDDGRGGPPTRVHVRVTKRGERLAIDLSGCDRQVAGAMNVPWASSRAGIVYAVRAVVAPELGANDGLLRAVDINAPRGIVLNPDPPAAVSVRHNTCQRFADTLIRAMAVMWPEKAVGSSTVSFFCCNVGSISPLTGQPSVMADVVGGGTGATAVGDGIDGVDTYMSNVGVMPTEVVETNYCVRVLKTEFIPGSQGLGTFNGGLGLRREYQIVGVPQRVTYYSEQTHPDFAPRGASGGGDALPTRVTVIGPDGVEITGLAEKASLTLQPGTVLRVETAGGGGYGDPSGRSAEASDYDRRNGRV
jgi:N-methylhydantoinase B